MKCDEKTSARFERALSSLEPLWRAAYDEGVCRDAALSELTLKDCILEVVSRRYDEPHIVYRGREISYAESNEAACRLANALVSRGCGKGDAVCIMLGDIPELIIAFAACYKIGCVAVGVNPRSTCDEVARFMVDSGAHVLVLPEVLAGLVPADLAERGVEVRLAVAVGNDAGTKVRVEGAAQAGFCDSAPAFGGELAAWEELLASSHAEEPRVLVAPDDVAMLIYTGGTTGVSKGCPLTNRMLVWSQKCFFGFMRPLLRDARNMTSLLTSPMTHAYGMNFGINWDLVIGGTVVLAEALDGASLSRLIAEHRVTVWGAVPVLLNELSTYIERSGIELPSLSTVVVSCAATSSEVMRRFKASCSAARVVEDYGMTETSGPVTLTPMAKGASEGSVGVPVPDTDVLVVDFETARNPVPVGERGEVVFRGPQVITEYWHAPQESEDAFVGEWIRSGDVGYFDELGCLHVVDRIKDVIMVGGFSVFPREIDEVMHTHPAVIDSCTIGVFDERSGERPKSFVVVADGARVTEHALVEHCRERLIAYKCPKHVEFVDAIPLTAMGKPDKKELRRREEQRRASQPDCA